MQEQEALSKMIAPGQKRPSKWLNGVIQIHLTRACDKACYSCTQGSNLSGKPVMMNVEQFEQACDSLKGYWGVIGIFGGNPASNPHFEDMCRILKQKFPKYQCGLWCNNPLGKGRIMRETFNPSFSNLNVHLDMTAYQEFKRDWPESQPFGQTQDSRHSPPWVAMKDVLRKECPKCNGTGMSKAPPGDIASTWPCDSCNMSGEVYDEEKAWELISGCDINQHWSALIGVFRNQLRAWFCEIAGAQSMLHQHEPDYPDTGLDPTLNYDRYGNIITNSANEPLSVIHGAWKWWQLPMSSFAHQVRKHCHECGIPLRGYGELACSEDGKEQVSQTHQSIYTPKRVGRRVELVTLPSQLGTPLELATNYFGNGKLK